MLRLRLQDMYAPSEGRRIPDVALCCARVRGGAPTATSAAAHIAGSRAHEVASGAFLVLSFCAAHGRAAVFDRLGAFIAGYRVLLIAEPTSETKAIKPGITP